MSRTSLTSALALVLIGLAPGEAWGYAFGCSDGDGCWPQACTPELAAKWYPSVVPLLVDLDVRPAELSEAAWADAVAESMGVWNQVSACALELQNAGPAPHRAYGEESDHHEVFWITDSTEWLWQIGTNPTKTLGITSRRFYCGPPREIFDSDLAMNGTGYFDWTPGCDGCRSASHTVKHELGHVFGLGHACSSCEWSMMSGKSSSSFQLEDLQEDDIEAVRALYPGPEGELGDPCGDPTECAGGICLSVGGVDYCSQGCGGGCPDGYACALYEGQLVCALADGPGAICAAEGEGCAGRCCVKGLACVDAGGAAPACRAPCDEVGSACAGGQVCYAAGEGGVCLPPGTGGEGAGCAEGWDCQAGLVCVVAPGGASGSCSLPCALGSEECGDEAVCAEASDGSGVCVPRGDAGVGAACEAPWDCVAGALCVALEGLDPACLLACEPHIGCAAAGEACTAVGDAYVCLPEGPEHPDPSDPNGPNGPNDPNGEWSPDGQTPGLGGEGQSPASTSGSGAGGCAGGPGAGAWALALVAAWMAARRRRRRGALRASAGS